MRTHMEAVHLKGALQCPFCDLSSHDVTANEMTLHVNSAHLEYLTPEREDVAFLEDYESMSDFDSIWQLEKVSFLFFTYMWTVNMALRVVEFSREN